MRNRYYVVIYRADAPGFEKSAYKRRWRATHGEYYTELLGGMHVEACDPRFAAAVAYVGLFGPEAQARLNKVGVPPCALGGYAFGTIWRGLRRTWHYSRAFGIQFHYMHKQANRTCYFAVKDLTAPRRRCRPYPLRRPPREIPFSRN